MLKIKIINKDIEEEQVFKIKSLDSDLLENFNDKSEDFSLDNVLKNLKENKYELFLNSKVDNFIIFFKIIKNNFLFFIKTKTFKNILKNYKLLDILSLITFDSSNENFEFIHSNIKNFYNTKHF